MVSSIDVRVSKNSKMPFAYTGFKGCAIDCRNRQVEAGTLDRMDKDNVCNRCYACKLEAIRKNVKESHREKEAMSLVEPEVSYLYHKGMLRTAYNNGCRYVRLFDFGDLVNKAQLKIILQLVNDYTDVKFWLPTKRTDIIADVLEDGTITSIPDNLIIRESESRIARSIDDLRKLQDKYNLGVTFDTKGVREEDIFYMGNSYNNTSEDEWYICKGSCVKDRCTKCWEDGVTIFYPLR